MSIYIDSEETKFEENYKFLLRLASFEFNRVLLSTGNGQNLTIKPDDPDVHIITDAIRAYAHARMERCRFQDKMDKIHMLNDLMSELGESYLESRPVGGE